jgi:hypothetical protein
MRQILDAIWTHPTGGLTYDNQLIRDVGLLEQRNCTADAFQRNEFRIRVHFFKYL